MQSFLKKKTWFDLSTYLLPTHPLLVYVAALQTVRAVRAGSNEDSRPPRRRNPLVYLPFGRSLLMMAECYYWKGDAANETAMLNVVRERAGAEPLNGKVRIAEILAERARELY